MAGSPKRRARRARFEAWTKREDAAEQLFDFIGDGGSLVAFCRLNDFPYSTVHNWLTACAPREACYESAMRTRADYLADDIEVLADAPIPRDVDGRTDHGAVQHRRLQVDTRKWRAAKLYPRRYDDRVKVDAQIAGEATHAEEVSIYDLSNAELEAMLRKQLKLSPDVPITNEILYEVLVDAERKYLRAVTALANNRGVKRPSLQTSPDDS